MRIRPPASSVRWLVVWFALLGGGSSGFGQDALDELPFDYHATRGENPLTELFARVDAGTVTLEHDPQFGILPELLAALDIPVSSQGLVYSKTSLQSARISPENPRAIFFNDDVYVGWVQGSSLLELSTTDPHLGAAFYTIRMRPGRTVLRRENNGCLACHYLPSTQDVPGHTVRSVLTRSSGHINSLTRSFVTDHTSPFEERWGGWYVTGRLGGMKHMGNAFLEGEELVPHGDNDRPDVHDAIDTSRWLSPHSDIVALMVLEHQTEFQNTLTRARFEVQRAILEQASRERSGDADASPGTLDRALDDAARRVVDCLLFVDEAALPGPIAGSSSFAEDFAARGPFSRDGRSLREFDLQTRLFRYPCSYQIYSEAFRVVEPELRERIFTRLAAVLGGRVDADKYAHLDKPTREAITQILSDTIRDYPAAAATRQ
ncbi:hypothetical protein [Roseimaritima sediminicola]|uniref:hypothetical protein n=1 Tax=Roseimaritima sediminicola TaxID=2662066 RepID=UPI0012983422|nr:hypothetical protein [Roseimaritima sediminicola]